MDTSTSALFDSLQVVILLQIIIMVSPGTHFVRNCESHCRTSESQSKKTTNPKLKMLWPLCNQTVKLKTDFQNSLLQYTEIKI